MASGSAQSGNARAVVTLTFRYAATVPAADRLRGLEKPVLLRFQGPPELPALVLEDGTLPDRAVEGFERTERVRFAVEDGDVVTPSSGLVVVNFYYAKPGQEAAVLAQRLHASDVRQRLGLARGTVLRRIDGGAELPDVVWRCAFANPEARRADSATLDASPEWQPVPDKMETLLRHFARAGYWAVGPGK